MPEATMKDIMTKASQTPRKVPRVFTPKTVGRKHRKAFTLFVASLFVANEELASKFRKGAKDAKGKPILPLTNDQLKAAIINEYSHEDVTMASFEHGHQSIEKLRVEYHKGVLAKSCFPPENPGHPPVYSFRYNVEGQPVRSSSRNGTDLITNGDIRELFKRYGKIITETEKDLRKRLDRNPRKWNDDNATE